MGLVIGVIMGFIGIAILVIPFIIDIYQSRQQTNVNYKRALEASAGMIAIATIFMIGGLLLVGVISTWGLSKTEYSGLVSGFSGPGSNENTGALLNYLAYRNEGPGEYEGLGAEAIGSEFE